MAKRKLTPAYVIFYILFLPDTWQVLMGIVLAYFLVPTILKPDMSTSAVVMLYIMCATIGYAITVKPGRWISDKLKRAILKDRLP